MIQKKDLARHQIWLPLMLAVALVVGILVGQRLRSPVPAISVKEDGTLRNRGLAQGKIEEILRYIDVKYVDEVEREELVDKVIDNIIAELDPHSNYISAEQLRSVNEQLEGNFEGIGVEFLVLDDTITVVSPLSGGPSEAVGILAGDKIVMIEDTIVAGVDMELSNIINRLRGEKGSEVNIGIKRTGESDLLNFTVVRDKIPVHSVDVAQMIDDETGYIKVNRFSATTYEEFMTGVEELVEKQNMKNLIIDVRQNPGGYLQQAVNMLSQLFPDKDQLLVYTEGRSVNRSEYETTGRNFFKINNIAVLIDEGSASASEIIAGAVQDHDRGIVIGRRSFGKGLVQEQYNLRDGSALRLTVARYYTPSGRSIQKDYSDSDAYHQDVIQRMEAGELSDQSKMIVEDSTEFRTSGGRVVYGGGGITPDIFVPIDTILLNDYYLQLRQFVPQFMFTYADQNRDRLPKSLAEFLRTFSVDEITMESFLAYAAERDVAFKADKFEMIDAEIRRFMKARLGRLLFGDEGFYAVWTQKDREVQKALDALQESNPLQVLRQ